MNPSRKGDETEGTVLARVMDLGASVAVPFGDNDWYDLIVDDDQCRHRVQCKTGSWVNGTVRFNLYTSTVNADGRVDTEYTSEEIDPFAVYSDRTTSTGSPSRRPGLARCDSASRNPIRKPPHRGFGGPPITC